MRTLKITFHGKSVVYYPLRIAKVAGTLFLKFSDGSSLEVPAADLHTIEIVTSQTT